uniref:Uncharacterized protein n=1 Tax=Arundo donax TaxID=35708 RepID=A0A0A9EDM7_ARUDO
MDAARRERRHHRKKATLAAATVAAGNMAGGGAGGGGRAAAAARTAYGDVFGGRANDVDSRRERPSGRRRWRANVIEHRRVCAATLHFDLSSRGYVIGKLVQVTHKVHATCPVVVDAKKTKPIRFSKKACART